LQIVLTMVNNRVSALFGIEFPIVQAGMVWTSGWRLASAVSNAGALGLIGSASMYPDVLREHIRKCKAATDKPFGVNIPLLYADVDKHMQIIMDEDVKIIFTSAGNPKTWTGILKEKGITVVHVVSSSKFARKSEDAGCDAVVAEGFEAGGHNGREETTSFVLIPLVKEVVSIPVLGAGGIATGRQMLAAMVLGADGVQVGSRFVACEEASVHNSFKKMVIGATEGDTMLSLKQIVPARIMKNKFFYEVDAAEKAGASAEELTTLLGRGRAKRGMFEGDMVDGELEIGQVSAMLHDILPAGLIVENIWKEFSIALKDPIHQT
jgi:enoyl-[acyl-carrier protein] reductase II